MARQTFMEAFNPFLQNATNIWTQNILNKKELERQENEKIKAQREQAFIFDQLLGGSGKVQPSQNPNQVPTETIQTKSGLSPKRQISLISRLTKENKDLLKEYWTTPEKKQQKTVTIDGKTYLESPDYENVPTGDPIFTQPKKQEPIVTEDFIPANQVKGLENYPNDFNVNRITTKNPDGTETVKYGQPFTYKKQSININTGENLGEDLSKESTKILNDYQKKQQDLMAKLDVVRKGGTVIRYDMFGMPAGVYDEKGLTEELSSLNTQYNSYLDNNMGTDTSSDWGQLTSSFDMNDPQSQPSIYKTILENYKDKSKDIKWFKEMVHKFSAKFGYNPTSKFGTK